MREYYYLIKTDKPIETKTIEIELPKNKITTIKLIDEISWKEFKQRLIGYANMIHLEKYISKVEPNLDLEDLAKGIVDTADEQWLDQAQVVREWGDDSEWLQVEDAPDYDNLLKELIAEAVYENELDSEERKELEEFVEENKSDLDDLEEQAYNDYRDSLEYEPDC